MYSKSSSAAVRTRLQSPLHTAADDDFDLCVLYVFLILLYICTLTLFDFKFV